MLNLRVEKASFGYTGRLVLEDVSLQVNPGELVGVVGPNGSGKSTLIKGITRLVGCAAGSVHLNGHTVDQVSRMELARMVAVVPQNPVLPPLFTALEVVLLGRTPHQRLFQRESAVDMAVAVKALEATGARELAGRRVGELSGGERQRVCIARALTQETPVLLLDEPTADLDINYQLQVMSLLRRACREQGKLALAALHDLNLAAQFCDRLVMLKGGRVFAEGVPSSVMTSDNIRSVFGAEVTVLAHPVNGVPSVLLTGEGG
jgi:iron complex transport system ATP-binding protein